MVKMIENKVIFIQLPEIKKEPCIFSPKSEGDKFISNMGDEDNVRCFCCDNPDYLGCDIYNKRISSAKVINIKDYFISS